MAGPRGKKASSLSSRNKQYRKRAPQWKRVRDCIEGGDAVRESAPEYLPRLTDQTDAEYEAYALRPNFYDATARTADALSGLIFARKMVVDVPDSMLGMLDDIDLAGSTFEEFARHVVDEMLATDRGLIVANHNGNPSQPGTMASPSGRPYLRFYNAESLFDWRERSRKGATDLSFLKVHECIETVDPEDEFAVVETEQFRVFDFDETGAYRQRVFQETKSGPKLLEDLKPVINGKFWDRLPVVITSTDGEATPGKPTLLPLADANLTHWRTSADLYHGAHFCGIPTPYVTGVDLQPNDTLRLGGSEALVFKAPDAKVGFLEFTGAGLASLENLLNRNEDHMAALGGRMLQAEKKAAESGDSLRIKRSGEASALTRVALGASAALTSALRLVAEWMGEDPSAVSVSLNTDFVDETLTSDEINALVQTWQGGAMSLETLIWNLQRGGRLPDDASIDDEIEKIDNEAPARGTVGLDGFSALGSAFGNQTPTVNSNASPAA